MSQPQAQPQPQEKKVNSVQTFFKKNLTIGKHLVLQSLGKADKIEYPAPYEAMNTAFKMYTTHYLEVQQNFKKLTKSSSGVMEEEDLIGENMIRLSDFLKQDNLDRKLKEEREQEFLRLNNAPTTFPEPNADVSNKSAQTNTTDNKLAEQERKEKKKRAVNDSQIVDLMRNFGEALRNISLRRSDLNETVNGIYLSKLQEAIDEATLCRQKKEEYRELLVAENVEQNKLRGMKEKSNDLVKVSKAEKDFEEAKRKADDSYHNIMEEFDYQEEKRNTEYVNALRKVIGSYRSYFMVGAQLMQDLEKFIPTPASCDTVPHRKPVLQKMASQGKNITDSVAPKHVSVIQKMAPPPVKQNLYGVALDKIMERETETGNIPNTIELMMQFVEKHALDVEGIFRLAGDHDMMTALKKQLDNGKVPDFNPQKAVDIHNCANLIKSFVRELPMPILTFEKYDEFLAVPNMTSEDAKLAKVRELLSGLPRNHAMFLNRLLEMATRTAAQSEVNKMTPSNLAIVFGMNILRPLDDSNPLLLARDSKNIGGLCRFLIEHHADLADDFQKHAQNKPSKTITPTKTTTPSPQQPAAPTTTVSAPTPAPAPAQQHASPPPNNAANNAAAAAAAIQAKKQLPIIPPKKTLPKLPPSQNSAPQPPSTGSPRVASQSVFVKPTTAVQSPVHKQSNSNPFAFQGFIDPSDPFEVQTKPTASNTKASKPNTSTQPQQRTSALFDDDLFKQFENQQASSDDYLSDFDMYKSAQ